MANQNRNLQTGFSLVELLVAVMFIGILMAGMANVFKTSVSTLATSSEGISSARRNRMSIDLLYDDLNTVGLYITDLSSAPLLSASNPAFYILPNVAVPGASPDPTVGDPQTADQLFFYLDQPLPFEGTLVDTGGGGTNSARNASQAVMDGVALTVADGTFTVDCGTASYASMVRAGYSVVIKDSWEILFVQGAPSVSGSKVTFTLGTSPSMAMTGVGSSGAPSKTKHILQSGVLFYQPAQMVCYSVQMKLFDPQKATGVPCLVRDQGTWDSSGFVADPALQTIVAENVDGFKAYLSVNSGLSWAGLYAAYSGAPGYGSAGYPSASGLATGWTNGIQNDLNTQLSTSGGNAGRAGYTTTAGNPNWIRDIPTLVRLDITTRTATRRAEYSATPLTTTAYKDFTQSLVIVPRHSGLTMN
jgi:hypothetical protein